MDGNRDKLSKKGIDKFTKSWRHLPHFQSPNSVYFITSRCRFHQSGQQIELLPVERDIVFEAIKFLDGEKYVLYAVVVMPDHFHIIIQPTKKQDRSFYSISEIMHSIKSFTAHKILDRRVDRRVDKRDAYLTDYYGGLVDRTINCRSTVPVDHPIDQPVNHRVWQNENFDRIIRNEKELNQKIDYIINNPVTSGLVDNPDEYKWMYIK